MPPSLVSIGRLFQAMRHWHAQELTETAKALVDTDALAADSLIWPGFQAFYWNLKGLVATEERGFAHAFECHARALDLRRETDLVLEQAESLNNLGYLLIRLGDYEGAGGHLEAARKVYAAQKIDMAAAAPMHQRVIQLDEAG